MAEQTFPVLAEVSNLGLWPANPAERNDRILVGFSALVKVSSQNPHKSPSLRTQDVEKVSLHKNRTSCTINLENRGLMCKARRSNPRFPISLNGRRCVAWSV